ncbi:MAG: methyltransferase family protein [Caulobacteraceae bacterium]
MQPLIAECILWGVWYVTWWAAAAWAAPAARRAGVGAQAFNYLLTGLGAVFLFALNPRSPLRLSIVWRTPDAAAWALVAATAVAFAFCWWARLHLGRLWSGTTTLKADHRVVETGPYRLVRHPIYTGVLAAGLALAVMEGTLGAFIGLALFTLGFIGQTRGEEVFLRQELGAASYGAYAARTPMLLPWGRCG